MKITQPLLDIEVIQKSKMPLLDLFIRRTSVLTSTPEHLVEKIVKDQWKNANKKTQPCVPVGEIDISNMGIFYLSKSKAAKRIARLEKSNEQYLLDQQENPITKPGRDLTLQRNLDIIRSIRIKTKTAANEDECETHNRGN